MHEMPYTQAILELALKKAEGKRIRSIHLRVGWMSAIVPRSVEGFFEYLSKGTLARGAVLHFEMTPIRLVCESCRRIIDLAYDPAINPRRALSEVYRKGCSCGKGRLTILGGLGVDLAAIDVEDDCC